MPLISIFLTAISATVVPRIGAASADLGDGRPSVAPDAAPVLLTFFSVGCPDFDRHVTVFRDGSVVRREVEPRGETRVNRVTLTSKQLRELDTHLKDWRRQPNVYPMPSKGDMFYFYIKHDGHTVVAAGDRASAGVFNDLLDKIESY